MVHFKNAQMFTMTFCLFRSNFLFPYIWLITILTSHPFNAMSIEQSQHLPNKKAPSSIKGLDFDLETINVCLTLLSINLLRKIMNLNIFSVLKTPKDNEIQNLDPKNRPSIRKYENIRTPHHHHHNHHHHHHLGIQYQ